MPDEVRAGNAARRRVSDGHEPAHLRTQGSAEAAARAAPGHGWRACAKRARVDEQIRNASGRQKCSHAPRQGLSDGAAYRQGANELHQEAKRLRLQREACLRVKENGRAYVDALNALIRWAGKAEPLIAFDAELFAQFVNRIRVFSRTEAGFEMTCGMTLREPLTGRVCDTFRMAGETEPFGDPFRQAEHTYSLIQEAPDGNQ